MFTFSFPLPLTSFPSLPLPPSLPPFLSLSISAFPSFSSSPLMRSVFFLDTDTCVSLEFYVYLIVVMKGTEYLYHSISSINSWLCTNISLLCCLVMYHVPTLYCLTIFYITLQYSMYFTFNNLEMGFMQTFHGELAYKCKYSGTPMQGYTCIHIYFCSTLIHLSLEQLLQPTLP